MAIAFARISYHSRSQGHSAVAGAAYRSGSILLDERTGEVHHFENRSDVVYSKIMLPDGASEKFSDRETLWNAVEAAETRKNSQIAKDIILALPRDVDLSHQIDLATQFAQYHFVQHGIVADIAIHDHSDGNPHAHIYVTTRRLLGNRFDRYKARDLEPDVVRGRVVDPQYWGEQWRTLQNRYFEEHDIDLLVDANHIFSQRHEGRCRGSQAHYLKEENELRRAASIEVAVNDPDSVLNLLGSRDAVFSERDIAMLIHKNTETREEYETALLRLKSHRDLILLGPGDDGRDRYTTRANYQREAAMAEHAEQLVLRQGHLVEDALLERTLRKSSLNEEQRRALEHLAESGDLCAIVGRAGTGKSYMMNSARQMWEDAGYTVRGMAVSGIAAKGLEAGSGIPSNTIHSFKMQFAFGLTLGSRDILVMDEAGMTDLHDLALMVDITKASGAKLVLVGDPSQLQPVGPGAPFRAIVEQVGFAELNQIQRQHDPDDRVASVLLSQGKIGPAVDYYASKGCIHLVSPEQAKQSLVTEKEEDDGDGGSGGKVLASSPEGIIRLIEDWSQALSQENLPERLILAHRNSDVSALNQAARLAMARQDLLGKDSHIVQTANGSIPLSVGDRLIFLRNNRQLNLSNGEFGTVLKIKKDEITVRLGKQQGRTLTFSTATYQDFNYGYAATVHKSQGATFDHAFVYIAGRAWNRFLAYVAMTRHRKTLQLYAERDQFNSLAAIKTTLSRSGLKDSVLDWPLSYAIRRGFDPEKMIGRFIDQVARIKQVIHDKWLFIVNYEAFKRRLAHRQRIASQAERRNDAKKVALFVDLRRELAAQAKLMKQELPASEKFHQHHDYPAWFENTLLKNKLAFEIKQQHALFENALELNNIQSDALDKMALDHERAQAIKAYLAHYKKGQSVHCYRLAAQIQKNFKQHFSHIAFQTAQAGLSQPLICRQIESDALAYHRLKQFKHLNRDEKAAFRVVNHYHQVNRDIKSSLSKAYTLGGFDQLSDQAISVLQHQKSTSDHLSFKLVRHPDRYAKALDFYDLDPDKLVDGYDRHLARTRVKQLNEPSLSLSARDALCSELLSDKRYYPMIAEQSLDWSDLHKRNKVHQHRETLRNLSAQQRQHYQIVCQYQTARINAGIAWSQLFKDKESGDSISNARWQFAIGLSRTRDRLAHDIVSSHEDCMPFVSLTLLKLSDIEQHAIRYNDYLSNLKDRPCQKYKHQRKTASSIKQFEQHRKNQKSRTNQKRKIEKITNINKEETLDYQAINDALIQLGEEFYTRVLGEDFKRSGNTLRFGRKGSLTVTLNGPHQGSWHSFETDEGGGPLQLLMNPAHGWNLSFSEALQEGARLTGLSLVPSTIDIKPAQHKAQHAAEPVDQSDKIARARYYFQSAELISGTLGERYLREHRHIEGDLSAFRFHPAIRDDRTDNDGKQHTTYHPGVIIAARNNFGEITAVQSIILNPTTANKVSCDAVGAVKRTRGVLKGSAVPIRIGQSNKVIIAEGPETAASLLQAEPTASIYVTLGNIKNAASLGWLAKKHQTDTFYFAADNDGPKAKNVAALQSVAQSLWNEHQIKSMITIPKLPNREKCDFNDVLKECGIEGVKSQLERYKPLFSLQNEKREVIPEIEIHTRLHGSVNEWERLSTLKSTSIDRIIKYKYQLDKALKKQETEIYFRGFEKAVQSIVIDKKLFSKIEKIAPRLAKEFKSINEPPKEIKIDWLSKEFDPEFKQLKDLKDSASQYLVKFREELESISGTPTEKLLLKQMESTALRIIKNKATKEKFEKLAPVLSEKLTALSKFRAYEKDKGRDF